MSVAAKGRVLEHTVGDQRPVKVVLLETRHRQPNVWVDSMRLACRWLSEISVVNTADIPAGQNPHGYVYHSWRGAVREYDARERSWHVFAPLWHTGQTVKALVMAYQATGETGLLDAARRHAEFILAARISDRNDTQFGLIPAFENRNPGVSATSCMLEALDGLFDLGEAAGESRYTEAAVDALHWAARTVYLPDEGLFLDDFDLIEKRAESAPNTLTYGIPGRPLNDDGVFLRGHQAGGGKPLRDIFFAIADRLLRDERPAGNWIDFPPCRPAEGILHPRHAFWWGRPMVMAWKESGDKRYLACARRSAQWYARAQRSDGGMFRLTSVDFMTPSFGQAASGIFAAACLWRDLIAAGHGDEFREPLRRAIEFGRNMQFTNPSDPNLRGAILEKCLPLNGTDAPPFMVRDLGSIFYVQAVAGALINGLFD